jgi:peptidoglycan/LPS O-acetylase OafA/YrhL
VASDCQSAPVSNRRADIQGLRAIAVLVVVAFHAGLPLPGGFVGVDVFFVISGFVITAMLSREFQQSGRIGFGNFYLRRFKRLTPALAAMVAVTALVSVLIVSPLGPQQTTGQTAIGAVFLVANVVIAATTGDYFSAASETNPLLHTWSLSVEEQFYLVFPAILAIAWLMARRRCLALSPFFVVGGVAVISFTLAIVGATASTIPIPFPRITLGFYSPLTRAWEFAAGALLALLLAKWTPPANRPLKLVGLIGFAIVLASTLLISESTPFPGAWTLIPVVGTLFLLVSGTSSSAPTTRLLSTRPMVAVGDYSYSLYLWHWPLIAFAGLLWHGNTLALTGAALLSFVPAVLSYRLLEQPIRSAKPLTRSYWIRLVAGTIAPPLVIGSALWFCASLGWWSPSVHRLQQAIIPRSIAALADCDKRQPLGLGSLERCAWNDNSTGAPIYLLGDSHAAHFSNGLVEAGKALNRRVIIATAYSCPFLDVAFLDRMQSPSDNAACRKYLDDSLGYLKGAEKGLVVVSSSFSYWLNDSFEAGRSVGELSNNSSQKIVTFREGLTQTVAAIRKAGHNVLLVQDTPVLGWDPSRCSFLTVAHGSCKKEVPLEVALANVSELRQVMGDTARASKTGVFDSVAFLCSPETCSTEAPGFTRYSDTNHISVSQSVALAPDLAIAITLASGGVPPR